MAENIQEMNQALSEAVREALFRYEPIRGSDVSIVINSVNGAVTLSGAVRSRIMKSMAERLVRTVPNVKAVDNQLVADAELETSVALALAMNAGLRAAGGGIHVKALLGTVYLTGDIASDSVAEAEQLKGTAGELTAGMAGVAHVVNGVLARERGQAMASSSQVDDAGGPSAEVAAKLAELRERRDNWVQRATAAA